MKVCDGLSGWDNFVMIIMGVNYWPNFQSGSGGRKRKGDPLSFLPTLPAVSIMPNLVVV